MRQINIEFQYASLHLLFEGAVTNILLVASLYAGVLDYLNGIGFRLAKVKAV